MRDILVSHSEQLLILREEVDSWEGRYVECNSRLIDAQIRLQELLEQRAKDARSQSRAGYGGLTQPWQHCGFVYVA